MKNPPNQQPPLKSSAPKAAFETNFNAVESRRTELKRLRAENTRLAAHEAAHGKPEAAP